MILIVVVGIQHGGCGFQQAPDFGILIAAKDLEKEQKSCNNETALVFVRFATVSFRCFATPRTLRLINLLPWQV